MNNFAKATRLKLTFETAKGHVSVQDLWDLPETVLRLTANTLNRNLVKPEDLFAVTTVGEDLNKLRLDIIMEIIEVRKDELVAKINAAEVAQNKTFLKELIQKKKLDAKSEMSVEDLEAELAKIK